MNLLVQLKITCKQTKNMSLKDSYFILKFMFTILIKNIKNQFNV